MARKTRWDEALMYLRPGPYWRPSPTRGLVRGLPPLGRYPIDITPRLGEGFYDLFDENGIPVRDYGGRVGRQYNPTTLASYGLAQLDLYLQGGPDRHRDLFMIQANWLRQHAVLRDDRAVVWEYQFDWIHGLKRPWISGMAQGEAISVLCRAYLLTGVSEWLDLAVGAVRVFSLPSTRGGVLDYLDDTWPVYQESPTQPPSNILNGFMYALFGLDDLAQVTADPLPQRLLSDGLESLCRCLPRWDLGYWSRYDLYDPARPNPASLTYHQLHIAQLEALFRRFGAPELSQWAERWRACLGSPLKRMRSLAAKSLHKLVRY